MEGSGYTRDRKRGLIEGHAEGLGSRTLLGGPWGLENYLYLRRYPYYDPQFGAHHWVIMV